MMSTATYAQTPNSPAGETVDLQITVAPCVAHLEQRLREIIAIELRTSARVDEHAALTRFHAWVRCVRGGVLLEVRSEDGEAEAAQRLSAAAMRGPDPARTVALSLVELLEPALAEAEAEAEAAAQAAEARAAEARAAAARAAAEAQANETETDVTEEVDGSEGEPDAEDESASAQPASAVHGLRTWGIAAELAWRPPFGDHPHMGGLRIRGLRALTDRVRLEFGGQLERGGRHVRLGRVVVSSLALDASVLVSAFRSYTVNVSVGAGARFGGLFWRGRANADDIEATRMRSPHVDLFARAVADWYVVSRWGLRVDLELGGVLVGSRAAAVDNADRRSVAVSGFRAALALGVVHAF